MFCLLTSGYLLLMSLVDLNLMMIEFEVKWRSQVLRGLMQNHPLRFGDDW